MWQTNKHYVVAINNIILTAPMFCQNLKLKLMCSNNEGSMHDVFNSSVFPSITRYVYVNDCAELAIVASYI